MIDKKRHKFGPVNVSFPNYKVTGINLTSAEVVNDYSHCTLYRFTLGFY